MNKNCFEDYTVESAWSARAGQSPRRTSSFSRPSPGTGIPSTRRGVRKEVVFRERIATDAGAGRGIGPDVPPGPQRPPSRASLPFTGWKDRFTGPSIGDTIRCEAVVDGAQGGERKDGVLRYEASIKNQRDEVCIVFHPGFLVGRRKA